MLKGVIVGLDEELCNEFELMLADVGHAAISRRLPSYPLGAEVMPFLRAHAPNVVFVCLNNLGKALAFVRDLEQAAPGVPVVALERDCPPPVLLEVMRAGIREMLTAPFRRAATLDVLIRIQRQVASAPPAIPETENVFAFLAAKGGAGASVIAANTATALSEQPAARTALLDCDLVNGMTKLLFRSDNDYTFLDAARQAHGLDPDDWKEMIVRRESLDILAAGRSAPHERIEPSQMRNLLGYARRNYDAVCLDVPGLNQVMIETLQQAKRIFLIGTPEAESLFQVREKLRYFAAKDMGAAVRIVLNRMSRNAQFKQRDCEEVLGQAVYAVFDNDYRETYKAIQQGAPLDRATTLGKQFRKFAAGLTAPEQAAAKPAHHRFLEHFFVMPNARSGEPQPRRTWFNN